MAAHSLIPLASRPLPNRRRRSHHAIRKPHPLPSRKSLYIWLSVLLLLLLLHDLIFRPIPPQPESLPGIPASSLPLPNSAPYFPAAYFGVQVRFLFYTSSYGQFNNQLVSLINSLFVARNADAVLVLPYTTLGKESVRDLQRTGLLPQASIARELVGHYFNYSHLAQYEHVVRPSQFFASTDAVDLLQRPNITVNYRSGNAYRKLFAEPAAQIAKEKGALSLVDVISPVHQRSPIANVCHFSVKAALEPVAGLGRNGRFTMLPIMFRAHNLNCSYEETDWVRIRRGLVPRLEFLEAVDGFLKGLERPVIALHLRVFLNGDLGNFTAESFVAMLERLFGNQLATSRTLFLAYSQSSDISREVFQLLKRRFKGLVVDGSGISSYFRKGEEQFASFPLANVLMDMWVCIKSDLFVGRLGSSLSWNVVYWRQAFAKEYGLEKDVVTKPLWYSLRDFTTTGARRHEGRVIGSSRSHHLQLPLRTD